MKKTFNKKDYSSAKNAPKEFKTALKVGDMVVVISGGNTKTNKVAVGQKGKIKSFVSKKQRVIVEGVNFVKRHKKAMTAQEDSQVVVKEGSIHISNVMFYNEELKRPVRIKFKTLENGKKVRGFLNPTSKEFQQIEA